MVRSCGRDLIRFSFGMGKKVSKSEEMCGRIGGTVFIY